MARSSTTWKPGFARPEAGKTLAEKNAQRTITEAFRSLADPLDLGRALLSIAAGVDPWANTERKPDNMPNELAGPIDWTHRLAATKLYLEYAWGKPMQGVAIQAEIAMKQTIASDHEHVTEIRQIVGADPAARELMRALAAKIAGVAAPAPIAPPIIEMIPTPTLEDVLELEDGEESDE